MAHQTACSVVSLLSSSFAGDPALQDWEDLRSFMLALMTLIASMHALGVAHRDLKPANLLMLSLADGLKPPNSVCFKFRGKWHRIVICDFGLAHISCNEYHGRGSMLQQHQVQDMKLRRDCVQQPQPSENVPAKKAIPIAASSARAQTIFQSLQQPPNKRHCTKLESVAARQVGTSSMLEKISAQDLDKMYRTFHGRRDSPICTPPRPFSSFVLKSLGSGTPGYRPPKYRPLCMNRHAHWMAADVWAAGIIFLDVLSCGRMHAMRRADARLGRDDKGWELLCHSAVRLDPGKPSPRSIWPLLSRSEDTIKKRSKESLQLLPAKSLPVGDPDWSESLDLLGSLMCYSSSERVSAEEALQHPFLAKKAL